MNTEELAHELVAGFSSVPVPRHSPFWQSDHPVLWLAAHDLVRNPETYYRDLAEAFGMEFTSELPVMMDDSASVANIVGPSVLTRLSFFLYREGEEVVVACADPFLAAEIEATCRACVGEDATLRFVMASLASIRQAIAHSTYLTTRARAETGLSFGAPEYSSRGIISNAFRLRLLVIVAANIGLLIWQPVIWLVVFFILTNALYFLLTPFRLAVCLRAVRFNLPAAEWSGGLPDALCPTYTVLVPGYDEAAIAPSLIRALRDIDYPADKLDIKMIVEVADRATIDAYAREGVDESDLADATHTIFHLVKVPNGELSTKPRACNYALEFARGSMTVIYDAEDRPDPQQLRKAFLAIVDEPLNTLCLQAKLNFYNPNDNLLTRFFALEYGFWYDFMLPGLRAWDIPIPLGGTSNHFLTETLRKIGGWDAYNVTEDADLGWRLSQLGYRTAMLDSYTYEEANSQLWNWITQRTRWQKGFLITTLVHLRNPLQVARRLGFYGFVSSSAVFLTNFLLPLINPILWMLFALWYVPPLFDMAPIGLGLSDTLELVGLVNLILGNGVFMISYLISAFSRRQWSELLLAPLMPLYWLLISVAAYRSLYQVVTSPYRWEKTRHGLSATGTA
ncbi:glycosyltransferase family 2 protein [Mycolicibacterium palauense]|uniref:glycosyltransferase family 2 protein n=1 Tax=Mycolicibacterium palauense TaxID=2034511 RepID=UPI00159B99CD|nr:glycosyltransferase family 2 protein [Mycolicibacterium palauense]